MVYWWDTIIFAELLGQYVRDTFTNPDLPPYYRDQKLHEYYDPWMEKILWKHWMFDCVDKETTKFAFPMWGDVLTDGEDTRELANYYTSAKVIASWIHLLDVPGESGLYYQVKPGKKIYYPERKTDHILFSPPWIKRGIDKVDGNHTRTFVCGNVVRLN